MLDHGEIRDCALLATAVYSGTEVQIGTFLAQRGHRFNGGITCSNIPNEEGHFVIARLREENRTTTYLAVRGSFVLEDWGANLQAWPTFQEMGMVHAGWYARMLHLPQHLLIQCIKDGHRVVICGHSLGGAVAQLLTLSVLQSFAGDAAEAEIRLRIKCISFAGPMVISGSVAVDQVNNHYKDNFVTFAHQTDVVPRVLSFAQAALKDLSNQKGKERSVTSLVTMLHSAVDPTAYDRLTVQAFGALVRTGTAALLESTAVQVALSYRPIGHYYKIDGPPATPLSPQTAAELEELVAWTSVELSTDAVHAHSMTGVYLQAVLSKLDSSATGAIVRTEPPSLQLPRPVIHRVDLHRTGGRVLVRIFGDNLYTVKSVTSSVLPLCVVDHRVSATALVSAKQLMFTVDPLPANYARAKAVSATTTAQLLILPGLCWKDTIVFPSIPVRVVGSHPMDMFSLQELVIVAVYLLLFVSREQGHHDHPMFSMLRKLLMEIIVTIPLSVYFSSYSPVARSCLEEHPTIVIPVLMKQSATRAALGAYIRDGSAVYRSLGDSDEAEALRLHLDALEQRLNSELPQGRGSHVEHNILTLLALCHHPPLVDHDSGLEILLKVLGGPLHLARAALQAELTPQTYRTFLGALAVGLNSTTAQFEQLGKYFNPAQTELGPLNSALHAFLNIPLIQVLLGVLFAVPFMMLFQSTLLLSSAAVGRALLHMLGAYFPTDVLMSSAGLRDGMLNLLCLNVPEGATIGEMEAALSAKLRVKYRFGPFNNSEDLRPVVSQCFPRVDQNNKDYPDVLRRLKLTVLCDALRTTLHHLPVALVTGPTRSGKSTFREHMQDRCPDRTRFGPTVRQRTSVPELFFCGEPDRPIGLLDSIGLGDPTSNEVFAAIEQANNIFRMFCQASVVVVNESDTSAAGRSLMHHTSVITRPAVLPEAAPVEHPTITCFTNADKMLGVGGVFPEDEDGPATLLQEARDRVVRGEPFDLRSPQEDPFAPRVLACFEGRIQLPEEYNGVVYTTAQVKEWLYSHFYPER
jgi:hypothetical protein